MNITRKFDEAAVCLAGLFVCMADLPTCDKTGAAASPIPASLLLDIGQQQTADSRQQTADDIH